MTKAEIIHARQRSVAKLTRRLSRTEHATRYMEVKLTDCKNIQDTNFTVYRLRYLKNNPGIYGYIRLLCKRGGRYWKLRLVLICDQDIDYMDTIASYTGYLVDEIFSSDCVSDIVNDVVLEDYHETGFSFKLFGRSTLRGI